MALDAPSFIMTDSPLDRRPPILVTGTHRSGTTWVGEMLCLSPGAYYVHEPFAPMNQRSWLSTPPQTRYLYQSPDVAGPLGPQLEAIARLRPPRWRILRRSPGPRHVLRVGQDLLTARQAASQGARAVIKDPFALLMAEWIERQSGASVVVLVRHPAAFASSIKRLGWRLDVRWLLQQPELMAGELSDFRSQLEHDHELDLIDHAALVWNVLNSVTARYEADHPAWAVLPYETLAEAPMRKFRDLFGHLGLPWGHSVAAAIDERTSEGNAVEVAPADRGGTVRDSRKAIWTWQQRLSEEEVDRVRTATWPLAQRWYESDVWWEGGETSPSVNEL